MAQSGYTPILIYGSGTASNVPLAANLTSTAAGVELALNYADGKLFYKDSGGVVRVLAGTGGTGVVAGSNTQIQFNNSGVFGASSSLTWNGTVLGTTGFTASSDSTFTSTGALTISKGTTAQRPTANSGMLRFNTTTTEFEGYNGTAWASVGGAALSNDTTTATDEYPLFASATTGTAATLYTSNAQYLFKPSTGELKVKAPVAANGLLINADSVTSDYTVATGTNALSVGPITVASGVSVTVASGQRWLVL